MNPRLKLLSLPPLLLSMSSLVFAQTGIIVSQAGAGHRPLTNAPYSADRETERTQTSADGIHFVNKSRMRVYRDSAGRTRDEIFRLDSGSPTDEINSIDINDPVAGFRYHLDVRTHTVRRFALPVPPSKTIVPVNPPQGVNQVKVLPPHSIPRDTQFLGTQMIEGLVAEGRRTTLTIPAGLQGNDHPFTTVTETWTSTDLGIQLVGKHSDPRGEVVIRLTNIMRAEPDPALFQVPPGYTLVDPQSEARP